MALFMSKKRRDELLSLQKIVLPDSPDYLVCSERQLKEMACQMAENSLRITGDCSNILQTTVNPDVFFERLQLFAVHCVNLILLEKHVSFTGASPTTLYDVFLREKQEVIHEFLVRYFNKVDIKASGLKTAKGQFNQYQKFYDSLKPYFTEMDTNNVDYIETKYKAYTRLLEK